MATNGRGGVLERSSRLHPARRAFCATAPRCPLKNGLVIFRRVLRRFRRTEAARNVELSPPAALVRPANAAQRPGIRATRPSTQRPKVPPRNRSGIFRVFSRGAAVLFGAISSDSGPLEAPSSEGARLGKPRGRPASPLRTRGHFSSRKHGVFGRSQVLFGPNGPIPADRGLQNGRFRWRSRVGGPAKGRAPMSRHRVRGQISSRKHNGFGPSRPFFGPNGHRGPPMRDSKTRLSTTSARGTDPESAAKSTPSPRGTLFSSSFLEVFGPEANLFRPDFDESSSRKHSQRGRLGAVRPPHRTLPLSFRRGSISTVKTRRFRSVAGTFRTKRTNTGRSRPSKRPVSVEE